MKRARVIPVLLLHQGGLVKTRKFKSPTYVGDPINAVKIFNEKEIDEIVILDIDATREKRGPDMKVIREIAGEAFIPLAYGGGISNIEQVKELFYIGVEKVVFNYQAYSNPSLLTEASKLVGSQSVVASIDIRKNLFGKYKVVLKNGTESIEQDYLSYARNLEKAGAGEIFINLVDRDGMYSGYDVEVVEKLASVLSIPLIVCGGAGSLEDFRKAIQSGASAVAAGSFFVFQRPHNAVLISYPSRKELLQKVFA